MKLDYIVVRIFDDVWVIFEDNFMENNPFRTQNLIIEVLSKLYDKDDFSVSYFTHHFKDMK